MALITKKLIVITGIPGSGKSTTARRLSEKFGYGYVGSDIYRYKPNTWIPETYATFRQNMIEAINKSESDIVVVESACGNSRDNDRFELLCEFIQYAIEYWIIKPEPMAKQISRLIDRSIKRYIGEDTTASAPETSESRAWLVIKNVEYYSEHLEYISKIQSKVPADILKFDTLENLCKNL